MVITNDKDNHIFLQGEGEMKQLFRSTDWSKTPLGDINSWPDTLILAVSLMLENPFPMAIMWGEEHIHLYNDAYRPILGSLKHPKALGANVLDTFAEVRKDLEPMIKSVLNGKAIRYPELKLIVNRNGYAEELYFDFSYSAMKLKTGEISGVLTVVKETTQAVNARLALENSRKVLKNMVLESPVAMAIFRGPDHIVEVVNTKVLELWGKTEEEAINKPIFEVLPEAGEQGLKKLMHQVYLTGERFTANELPVPLYRNGKVQTIHVNFVYESVMADDPVNAGVLSVAVDVTEQVMARQKAEEAAAQLGESNAKLQKSNAELAQFAYIASHDLQEPLRKVMTFTQMLEKSATDKLDERSQKYLNKINDAASRMSRLIRDVLSYSELAKRNDIFVNVDLNGVVKNIIADFDLAIEEKGAKIIFENLPVIEALPLQMSQLFGNLIGNALKFAKQDTPPIINISATKVAKQDISDFEPLSQADYYKLQFKDNGIGIEPEFIAKIFDIFQRLHRKSEYEGTGIGLALCKKIALNHKGDITAEGSNDGGAVFNVYLPSEQKQ